MFERLLEQVEAMARAQAEARAAELADRLSEALPPGIDVDAMQEGLRLSGRGLLHRFIVDPALRWRALQCARDEGRKR